ncbi:hypothetical protein B0H16DRAFT_1589209 [Mycena metata]|uniref:F-box domain-containing protein n=1 Tax=Mycena metata TaxID=1033252 RepID=A0AAD7HUX9_9AGAR|nr:hypothetical protein B0H16DRAFT_1589209 [Mycena metata]
MVAESPSLSYPSGTVINNSTPALTIPPEITAHIFIKCLPTDGLASPSPSTAPLVLAQICRDWRNIALHTPELWSSIHLQFFSKRRKLAPGKKAADAAVHLFKTWASRAGKHLRSHFDPLSAACAPEM